MTYRVVARHRGVALIYVAVIMVVLVGLTSLAVDFGHAQAVKTQLEGVTDSAARYGSLGLKNILNGTSAAYNNAAAAAQDNYIDGQRVTLSPSNVTIGVWDAAHAKFTANSDPTVANAVQVSIQWTVQCPFGSALGAGASTVRAKSIAMLTPGASDTRAIPASDDPFLAGMPAGTATKPVHASDYADTATQKNESPELSSIGTIPGRSLTFDGINGSATYHNSSTLYDADGCPTAVGDNYQGSEFGIGNMTAPLTSLVAVFLDDNRPDTTAAPTQALDFSTPASRDFQQLKPDLKQVFFIGDGRTSTGVVQQFVVPPGATRLFIGAWDRYGWTGNIGGFTVTVHQPGSTSIVQ